MWHQSGFTSYNVSIVYCINPAITPPEGASLSLPSPFLSRRDEGWPVLYMERDCLIVQRWPEELHLLHAGSRLNSLEVLPQTAHLCLCRRKNSTNKTHRYVLPAVRTALFEGCQPSRACLSDGRIKILRLRWRWGNGSVILTWKIWSAWRKNCSSTTVFSGRKLTWIFLNYI